MTLTTIEPPSRSLLHANWYNDSIKRAKLRPRPKMLFGEFWLEGELAILFAGTGRGKSVLATQIAESIARGRPIAPFKLTAEPRRVGYIDLEMSEKQLEMRYSADAGDNTKYLRKHHRFPANMLRITLDAAAYTRGKHIEQDLIAAIEEKVREYDLKVVILDNITFLKRSSHGTREMLAVILGLNRIKHDLGLSILVLAHTPRHEHTRPLTVNDLQSARVIFNVADSVFAIGQSLTDASEKYLKQIFSRSTELIYDASHVPVFQLKKIGGNFLGFEFTGYAPERELLNDVREHREWENIERIKDLYDGGGKIRDIAEKLSLSKTKAHRLLQMWRPSKVNLNAETQRRGAEEAFEKEDECRCEMSIEDAREQYVKSRDQQKPAPRAATQLSVPPAVAGGASERLKDKGEGIKENEAGSVDPSPAGPQCGSPHEVRAIHSTRPHELPSCTGGVAEGQGGRTPQHTDTTTVAEPPQIIDTPYRHTAARPEVLDHFAGTGRDRDPACEFIEVEIHYDTPAADEAPRPTSVRLHRTFDEEGREIFVEKYTEWGRRRIWYQVNERGTIFRKLYTGICVEVTNVVKIGSQVRSKPPNEAQPFGGGLLPAVR